MCDIEEINTTSNEGLGFKSEYNRKFREMHCSMLKRVPTEACENGFREYICMMSMTDQLLYDVHMLVLDTENGGLLQWLTNPFGDRYDIMVDHLHKIGAPQAKSVLLKLKSVFPDGYVPFSQEDRRRIVHSISDEVEEGIFGIPTYRLLVECEDLFDLAARYIEALGDSTEKVRSIEHGRW